MFVTYIVSKIRAYLRYRAAAHELAQLSDRQLSDIGINRQMIDFIAWQSRKA